jgi:hypothetical protein
MENNPSQCQHKPPHRFLKNYEIALNGDISLPSCIAIKKSNTNIQIPFLKELRTPIPCIYTNILSPKECKKCAMIKLSHYRPGQALRAPGG